MIESGLVIKRFIFGVSSDYIQKNEGYVMMSKGRGRKGLPFDQSSKLSLLYHTIKKRHYSKNIEL